VGDSTVWKELSALTALRELHCYGPDLQFRPDGVAALPGLTCLTFDTEVRDMKVRVRNRKYQQKVSNNSSR
jgi:hypothetical protein